MEGRKRTIEIFSAVCTCCEDMIAKIRQAACPSCDITVLDMRNREVAGRAKQLGIRSVPSVVIDGKLASCCDGRGPDLETLRSVGLGVALS